MAPDFSFNRPRTVAVAAFCAVFICESHLHAELIPGSSELSPLPGVMTAPGTFEWQDFSDALGVHPDTVELGTWTEIPLPPFDPALPSVVIRVSVDEGSTLDGVGFPSADVFDPPGGYTLSFQTDIGPVSLPAVAGDFLSLDPAVFTSERPGADIDAIELNKGGSVFPLFLATSGTTLSITVTTVPEPSTAVLAALALVGLLAHGHLRRRA